MPTLLPTTLYIVFFSGIFFRLPLQIALSIGAAIRKRIYVVNPILAARTGWGILLFELSHGRG